MFPVESLGFYVASNLTRVEQSHMESNLARLTQLNCNYLPQIQTKCHFPLITHLANCGLINWPTIIGITECQL